MPQPAVMRLGLQALLVFALSFWPDVVQADETVKINNLAYDAKRHSLVLDITGPVTISTRSLKAPPRLVVDVPSATLVSRNRKLEIFDGLFKRVRVSQFQIVPPVVRVVIETASEAEPLIAVQQTNTQLFITLAPAHRAEPSEEPSEAPEATPAPRASATLAPTPIERPGATPPAMPSPRLNAPASPLPRTPVPSPRPTLHATPTPRPTPELRPQSQRTPAPSPAATAHTPQPRRSTLPRDHAPFPGETDNETLPSLPAS